MWFYKRWTFYRVGTVAHNGVLAEWDSPEISLLGLDIVRPVTRLGIHLRSAEDDSPTSARSCKENRNERESKAHIALHTEKKCSEMFCCHTFGRFSDPNAKVRLYEWFTNNTNTHQSFVVQPAHCSSYPSSIREQHASWSCCVHTHEATHALRTAKWKRLTINNTHALLCMKRQDEHAGMLMKAAPPLLPLRRDASPTSPVCPLTCFTFSSVLAGWSFSKRQLSWLRISVRTRNALNPCNNWTALMLNYLLYQVFSMLLAADVKHVLARAAWLQNRNSSS